MWDRVRLLFKEVGLSADSCISFRDSPGKGWLLSTTIIGSSVVLSPRNGTLLSTLRFDLKEIGKPCFTIKPCWIRDTKGKRNSKYPTESKNKNKIAIVLHCDKNTFMIVFLQQIKKKLSIQKVPVNHLDVSNSEFERLFQWLGSKLGWCFNKTCEDFLSDRKQKLT